MQNFKEYFFLNLKLGLIYCLLSITLSCSLFITPLKSSLIQQKSDAPFIVDQIKGQVVATRINGLPTEIQISYTACFRDDIHPDNTLQNSLFKIYFFENFNSPVKKDTKNLKSNTQCSKNSSFLFSASSQKISCMQIRTDSSGCLNWTEVYPFRPVNKSVWFRYDRMFEGTGTRVGTVTIPMAVNPWLAIDPSGSAIQLQLVDLRYHLIHKKWKLIKLQSNQIPACRQCLLNKKDCAACEIKKHSLSYITSHFYKNQTQRPRLWLNGLNSHINQEHIPIYKKNNSTEYLQVLKQFKVCHLDIKKNCDFPGRFFKVRLQMPLRVQVTNYRNEKELLPLTRGKYLIKVYLFLKDESGKHIILHRDTGLISASLFKGSKEMSLTSEFYFHIPYEHYGLSAFLGVKIQEKDNLFFTPFEGVFSFPNRLKSVIGSNTLHLNHEVLSFYKKNTSKNISLLDSYNFSGVWLNQKPGFRRAGWDVKLNRMRFSEVSLENKTCPTPIDRTIHYVGEICIVDPLINEVVPNASIEIKRQDIFFTSDTHSWDGDVIKIPSLQKKIENFTDKDIIKNPKNNMYISDTTGCIQWVDSLYHKWYDREKYFIRKMIFSKKEWGFEGERTIAINPWQWGFMFFQDITQLGNTSVRTVTHRAERPQVILHDFKSLLINPIYTIDRWLGINIFQNLNFLFKVRVERPDNISSSQGGEKSSARNIRRGYYFLRFVLVKSPEEENGGQGNQVVNHQRFKKQYDNSQSQPWNINTGWSVGRDGKRIGQMMNTNLEYITHFDTHVQIRDGTVNAYINLLFDLDQFIFIGSKNRLIVQLLTTDPQYYVYYPNSCEIDPKKSTFVPFTDHELISPPFMGSFIPETQRNWNILKPLKHSLILNMDFKQLDQFIKKQKNISAEHKLFKKLQTQLIVNTNKWSPKAREFILNSEHLLKKLHTDINAFLQTTPDSTLLSPFHQKKNKIIESINKITLFISETLKGSIESQEKVFLTKLNKLIYKTLLLLSVSSKTLQEDLKQINNSLLSLVHNQLPVKQKMMALQAQQKNINTGFIPNKKNSTEPKNWSTDNMNLFAQSEGLKVINMDNSPLVTHFLQDLNNIALSHNNYRTNTFENTQNFAESDTFKNQEMLWNNFAIINPADHSALNTKIDQMFLPKISKENLNTVIINGVNSSTINTLEVMSFLHSMCGFWFDTFYEKYLEQKQLDVIYDKHLEYFRYYKSTLEYFLKNKSANQQYKELYLAMEQYLNAPKNTLTPSSPFQKKSISAKTTKNSGVLHSMYENKKQSLMLNIRNKIKDILDTVGLYPDDVEESLAILSDVYQSPFFTCMANPNKFFHIEKKIIVGDIGSDYADLQYEYGYNKTINLNRALNYSYSTNTRNGTSFATAIGGSITLLDSFGLGGNLIPPIFKWVSYIVNFRGIRLDTKWDTTRSDFDQNSRSAAFQLSNAKLDLQVNRSVMTIRLKNFRHCLTIRAKNLAFDGYKKNTIWRKNLENNLIHQIPYIKSGLMICSKDISEKTQTQPFYITEDYFHIYQPAPQNTGYFQNHFSFRNRPFVISLRGATEMQKFSYLMQAFVAPNKSGEVEDYDPFGLLTNLNNKKPKIFEGTKNAFSAAKVWDKTGFYPGVYNVLHKTDNYYLNQDKIKKTSTFEKFGQWMYKHNPLETISINE